jgi:hypothetical protein
LKLVHELRLGHGYQDDPSAELFWINRMPFRERQVAVVAVQLEGSAPSRRLTPANPTEEVQMVSQEGSSAAELDDRNVSTLEQLEWNNLVFLEKFENIEEPDVLDGLNCQDGSCDTEYSEQKPEQMGRNEDAEELKEPRNPKKLQENEEVEVVEAVDEFAAKQPETEFHDVDEVSMPGGAESEVASVQTGPTDRSNAACQTDQVASALLTAMRVTPLGSILDRYAAEDDELTWDGDRRETVQCQG